MEVIIFLGILVLICFLAYLLGLRDEKNLEKKLLAKLKRDYGKAPGRKYKEDDLDHLNGYFLKHPNGFQIDDTTWNDLNMDGVFARLNYCLSATGEEYLYHMLRTPSQSGDMEDLERHIEFFRNNDDARYSFQLIFAKIGRKIRYSIYDYIAYLDDMPDLSNRKHFMMLGLMAIAVATCFINFTTGFTALVILMVANIIMYFAKKGEIEPYLATYGYIMKVVKSVELFEKIKYPEVEKDIDDLVDAAKAFKSFERGSYILMSPSRMNSGGNPVEILLDYIRMSTHIDIIKFNQMYKEIIAHKDELDRILTITGRLEAQISIACYRESVKEQFARPVFVKDGAYSAQNLIHPLIENCVANSVNTQNGMLITGSNASGKSTFLKSCAVNAILAQSLNTVLAKSYSAPVFRLYSSMALKDDIFGGDSYYIVEIKSIKRIIDAAKENGAKVLCFVDEVLRGTNTIERIAASTQILKSFSEAGVLCFAATHDIELTSLLKNIFDIYHFEGIVTDNDVHFDYSIKEGPATNRNAIKLLGVLGYDEKIVDDAKQLAEHFLSTGVWT